MKRIAPFRPVFSEWNQGNIKHNEPFRLNGGSTHRTRIFPAINLRAYSINRVRRPGRFVRGCVAARLAETRIPIIILADHRTEDAVIVASADNDARRAVGTFFEHELLLVCLKDRGMTVGSEVRVRAQKLPGALGV